VTDILERREYVCKYYGKNFEWQMSKYYGGGGSIFETGNNVEVVVRLYWAQQKYGPVLAHKRGHGPTMRPS
jgi:hypothetical protein